MASDGPLLVTASVNSISSPASTGAAWAVLTIATSESTAVTYEPSSANGVVISRETADAALTRSEASGSDGSVAAGTVIVTDAFAGTSAIAHTIVVSPAPGPAVTEVSLKPAGGVALAARAV